jgi:DNA-binding transcriptional ArsR family regulator
VRILELLCDEALTTKQVAERLGEKPTRLYHHVDALVKAGLIRLADTRQVRGTVEQYYRAVAKAFRADPKVFQHPDAGADEHRTLADMASAVLQNTADEVRQLVLSGHDLASATEGVLSHLDLRASEAEIRELQAKLLDLLKDLEEKCCRGELSKGERHYRLNVAFFPLDRFSKTSSSD